MKFKLVLDGTEYVASYEAITRINIGELRTIKRETGLTVDQVHDKLTTLTKMDTDDPVMDIDLCAVFTYLLMSRSGHAVTWADVERIPLVELGAGFSVLDDEPTPPGPEPAPAVPEPDPRVEAATELVAAGG